MEKILIVEDDGTLAEGLCRALASREVAAKAVGSIREARAACFREEYALILLDVNLPDGSGFDYLKEIRKDSLTPVILLTANDMETDIVTGLESGADDYITKPFSLAVLRARVNIQLRRRGPKENALVFRTGDYVFDFRRMEFYGKEGRAELSRTEQKLLLVFVENPGITLTREALLDRVWGDEREYVEENTLSVTIKRLRDKLGAGDDIRTVYGIGYVWRHQDG